MRSFSELAAQRQSCRKFFPGRAIEREKLEEALRAAVLSPSAGNSQPWRYVAVDEPQRVRQLGECLADIEENGFCRDASAFVVVMEEKSGFGKKLGQSLYNQKFIGIDIGLSVAHIILAAADLGLASCVIGAFNERKVKTLLGIPKTRRLKLIIALGYDTDNIIREKLRRPFEETVTYNKF